MGVCLLWLFVDVVAVVDVVVVFRGGRGKVQVYQVPILFLPLNIKCHFDLPLINQNGQHFIYIYTSVAHYFMPQITSHSLH